MEMNDGTIVTPAGTSYRVTRRGNTSIRVVVIPGRAKSVRPHPSGWISEAGQTFPDLDAVADGLADQARRIRGEKQ
jgi:hypothetical protein